MRQRTKKRLFWLAGVIGCWVLVVLADILFGNLFWGRRYTTILSPYLPESLLLFGYGLFMTLSAIGIGCLLLFFSKKRLLGKGPLTTRSWLIWRISALLLLALLVFEVVSWLLPTLSSPLRFLCALAISGLEWVLTVFNGGQLPDGSNVYILLSWLYFYLTFFAIALLSYLPLSAFYRKKCLGILGGAVQTEEHNPLAPSEENNPLAPSLDGAQEVAQDGAVPVEPTAPAAALVTDDDPEYPVRRKKFWIGVGIGVLVVAIISLLESLTYLFANSATGIALYENGLDTFLIGSLVTDAACILLALAIFLFYRPALAKLPAMPRSLRGICLALSVIFLITTVITIIPHTIGIGNSGLAMTLYQIPNVFSIFGGMAADLLNKALVLLYGYFLRGGSPAETIATGSYQVFPWALMTAALYFSMRTLYRVRMSRMLTPGESTAAASEVSLDEEDSAETPESSLDEEQPQ